MGDVRISRVYEHEPRHGRIFFVERLWPRGVRRDELPPGAWAKDVAPSTELRRWYGHEVSRWEEFRRRYLAELDANPGGLRPLLEAASTGDIVLVYSARDREHNSALVLRDHLLERLAAP